jgi:hypothetical protein
MRAISRTTYEIFYNKKPIKGGLVSLGEDTQFPKDVYLKGNDTS